MVLRLLIDANVINYNFALTGSLPLFSKLATIDWIASDVDEGLVARPSSDR